MELMNLYNQFKSVPEDAKKPIEGGKLKGFTDINPMWRIQKLTEIFGPCGIGWKAPIVEEKIIPGANGEVIVIIKIQLSYKVDDKWSEPIDGNGGSMLIQTEKGKLVSNDEAFKMAYTDAISSAFKMIGGGADVYYSKDRTKYDMQAKDVAEDKRKNQPISIRAYSEVLKSMIMNEPNKAHYIKDIIDNEYSGKKSKDLTEEECKAILNIVEKIIDEENNVNE